MIMRRCFPRGTPPPDLAGATVTDKTPCTVTSSPYPKSRGTAMASLLVSKNYGVAPDARLLSYPTSFSSAGDESGSDCIGTNGVGAVSPTSLSNHAINDGAQIISVSSSNTRTTQSLKWAVARANARGVILVSPSGNDATDETIDSFGKWSGVVSVSAIDTSGKRAGKTRLRRPTAWQESARYQSRDQRNDSGYDHRYYADRKRVQDKEHPQPPQAVPTIAVVSGNGGNDEEGKHRRSAQE